MLLIPYAGFTEFNGVVPQLYWNVKSAEQRYHLICQKLHKLICYTDKITDSVNTLDDELETLANEFLQFKESGFYDYYAEQIEQWIQDNLPYIYETTIRQVYFGLNEQGYFVAYIPESWNDIQFDTGSDYTLDTYGRLILRMDVDSLNESVVQTPEVVRPLSDAELEQRIRNIMNTLYSVGG